MANTFEEIDLYGLASKEVRNNMKEEDAGKLTAFFIGLFAGMVMCIIASVGGFNSGLEAGRKEVIQYGVDSGKMEWLATENGKISWRFKTNESTNESR